MGCLKKTRNFWKNDCNRHESQRFECVIILHYPFMSNPRYCLGCATQKNDLHSFICLQLLFLCPVHNPFLPILRQPAQERPNFHPSVQKMYPACA